VRNDFLRTVEHIEEIGVRRDTYLDEFVGKFDSKFDTQFVVLSTRLSPVREGCFLIGVQRIHEVLSPDVAMDCVVVVLASVGIFSPVLWVKVSSIMTTSSLLHFVSLAC